MRQQFEQAAARADARSGVGPGSASRPLASTRAGTAGSAASTAKVARWPKWSIENPASSGPMNSDTE